MPSHWPPTLTLPPVLVPITSPPGSSLPPRSLPFVPSTLMSRTFKPHPQRSPAQIPTEIALTEVPCSTPFPAPTSLFLAQTTDTGALTSTHLLALISIMIVPEVSCTRWLTCTVQKIGPMDQLLPRLCLLPTLLTTPIPTRCMLDPSDSVVALVKLPQVSDWRLDLLERWSDWNDRFEKSLNDLQRGGPLWIPRPFFDICCCI